MPDPTNIIKGLYASVKNTKSPDLDHPSDDEISDFVTGIADEVLREKITQHLAKCFYCLDLIAERKKLMSLAEQNESAMFAQRAKQEINRFIDTQKIGEIVFGLADRVTKILKTTGQPSIALLAPARGATLDLFDTSGLVNQEMGGYRVGVGIDRKGQSQSVSVYLRNLEKDELVDGAEITLKNGEEHQAITQFGEITFPDLPFGRYLLSIRDGKQDVGKMLLELRELTESECLTDARNAIARGAYSKAKDFLTTVLAHKESDEALALAAILQRLKEIDPEGFRDDLVTRSSGALDDQMIEPTILDFDSLVQRIRDCNPILVEALDGIEHLQREEFDKALPIFKNLTHRLSNLSIGYIGVGLILENRKDINQLSAEESDDMIRHLEKAVELNPESQPLQQAYELALRAKAERIEKEKLSDVLHTAMLQMARDLTLLVERTGESLHQRFDTLEGKVDALLFRLDELKKQYSVSQPQSVSEPDLHNLSGVYSKAIVERVENFKTLLLKDYEQTQAWLIEQVDGDEYWENLGQSRLFLLTGEFVYQMLKKAGGSDFSPASLGYVKAVETLLNDKVVWNVQAWLGCDRGDKACIRAKLKPDFEMRDAYDRNVKILQDKRGRFVLAGEFTLSCWEMAETFAEMKSKATDWEVYRRLYDFLSAKSNVFFSKDFQGALRRISTEFRNGAVHSEPLSLEICEQCRELVLTQVNLLIKVF